MHWIKFSIGCREQTSSASGKAVSGMSSDEKNQRQISARALMPPPRPSNKLSRFGSSSGQNSSKQRSQFSTSRNISNSKSSSDFRVREPSRSGTGNGSSLSSNSDSHKPQTGHGSSLSSNSDAHKPRRKRRPKKKKQQLRLWPLNDFNLDNSCMMAKLRIAMAFGLASSHSFKNLTVTCYLDGSRSAVDLQGASFTGHCCDHIFTDLLD
ncbi:hypothetical protein L195_g029705 [Trifolium pratense]|uniref:Uncharacterized protein n=1 Tax=Trifolium pratense TaxID=57577 RepID=A0A2K3L5J1_TRIPR|nr:hypothetical protein L195_g029705 [Trifolium pratense]